MNIWNQYKTPLKMVFTIALLVFIIEAFIMFVVMKLLPPLPDWASNMIDPTILTIALIPSLYYLIYKPLVKEFNLHQQTEIERVKATEANLAKSSFLANMSHELRTPLNAILGLSEIMLEEMNETKDQSLIELVKRINNAGKHLLSIINDILDISKIEAGKMEIIIDEVIVKNLTDDLKAISSTLIKNNKNILMINVAENVGKIYTDAVKLRQILINLIGNAAKFTENGVVTITIKPLTKKGTEFLEFEISDTGIGMTPDQLKIIFDNFTQADFSITRKFGGTGLGLSIVYKLIQLLQGEITVNSVQNAGTTFRFTLPRYHLDYKKINQSLLLPAAKLGKANTVLKSKRILLIEDDESARLICKKYLENEGYEVMVAVNGADGVKMIKQYEFGVIILDIVLPDISGWEILTIIKSSPETKDTVVLVVSMVDDKNKGFALGANDYLIKPITREQILAILDKYTPHSSMMNLLIVDDDDNARYAIRRTLEKSKGVTVKEAENGSIAMNIIKNNHIDLIILDLMMPVMDGFEFIDQMRLTPYWETIPIIVSTAKTLTEEDQKRLAGRVANILQKGQCSNENLVSMINKALKNLLVHE